MRRAELLLLSLFWVAISATQNSSAQDALSDVIMLPCDGKCATITRALIRVSGSALPARTDCVRVDRIETHCPEGFVQVQYTIQADGHVADDISVVRVIGPPEFVEATKRTVRTFVYEPAMVDGQAVAISHELEAFFGVTGETGTRASVVKGYGEAAELLKAGRLEEAHA